MGGDNMIKYIKSIGLAVLGLALSASVTFAQTLDAVLSSSTAMVEDNMYTVLTWAAGLFALLLIIALGFGALKTGYRKIAGIFKRV